MNRYYNCRTGWIPKDMITNLLDIFSAPRIFDNWCVTIPNAQGWKKVTWGKFVEVMQNYYKATENLILKNYQFCSITQGTNQIFVAFCKRVGKEAEHCNFKCKSRDCTFEMVGVRDQFIVGTTNKKEGRSP